MSKSGKQKTYTNLQQSKKACQIRDKQKGMPNSDKEKMFTNFQQSKKACEI